VSVDIRRRPAQVTLVHSPACHFCDDAAQALNELSAQYEIEVVIVGVDSTVGATLVAVHRPAMNPLVLVDGEFFSSGRLPRKKLVKLLQERGAQLATAEH
jgi:alkyl hydroperoxide reductase subunit AhpF